MKIILNLVSLEGNRSKGFLQCFKKKQQEMQLIFDFHFLKIVLGKVKICKLMVYTKKNNETYLWMVLLP